MARDTRGHLVDPVGRVEKVMEKASSGVHQRPTWTKGVLSPTLTTLDQYLKVSGRCVPVDLQFLSILQCMVRYGNYETYIYTFTQSSASAIDTAD